MGNATSTVLDKVLKEIPEEQDKKSGVPTIRYSVAVLLDEEKDFSGQEEKDSISFHPVTTSSPIDHLPRANLKTNPLERNKQRASSFLVCLPKKRVYFDYPESLSPSKIWINAGPHSDPFIGIQIDRCFCDSTL